MTTHRTPRQLAEAYAEAAALAEREGNHKRAAFLYLIACGVLEGTLHRSVNDQSNIFAAAPRSDLPRRAEVSQFSTSLPEEALGRMTRRFA